MPYRSMRHPPPATGNDYMLAPRNISSTTLDILSLMSSFSGGLPMIFPRAEIDRHIASSSPTLTFSPASQLNPFTRQGRVISTL